VTVRSETLQALAARLAEQLPKSATEVVLTGSTARGVADELSDIELLVVSERLPDELPLAELQSWPPGSDGSTWYGGWVEGEKVDHARLRSAEAIAKGISLRGERHAAWAARLAHYPSGLAARIVDDVTDDWVDPVRSQRTNLRAGDALVLAQALVNTAEGILRIVFALNEEWEPGWKRLALRVEPLAVKPERLGERIDAAIRALDLHALRTLAAETLELAPPTEKTRLARERLLEPL
jgi:hypothetical protein